MLLGAGRRGGGCRTMRAIVKAARNGWCAKSPAKAGEPSPRCKRDVAQRSDAQRLVAGGEKSLLGPPGMCFCEQRGRSSRLRPSSSSASRNFTVSSTRDVLGHVPHDRSRFAGFRGGRRQHNQHRIGGQCHCLPDPFDLRGVKERRQWLDARALKKSSAPEKSALTPSIPVEPETGGYARGGRHGNGVQEADNRKYVVGPASLANPRTSRAWPYFLPRMMLGGSREKPSSRMAATSKTTQGEHRK